MLCILTVIHIIRGNVLTASKLLVLHSSSLLRDGPYLSLLLAVMKEYHSLDSKLVI